MTRIIRRALTFLGATALIVAGGAVAFVFHGVGEDATPWPDSSEEWD